MRPLVPQEPLEMTAPRRAATPPTQQGGSPDVLTPHRLTPHRLAALQRTAGNATVQRLLDEARQQRRGPVASAETGDGLGTSLASPHARATGTVILRTPEDDLVQEPETFLSRSALSLDCSLGMRLRTPQLELDFNAFVSRMGTWDRHWFVLVRDPRRHQDDRPAYLLTPAVEKYAEQFDTDPVFASTERSKLPAVLDDSAYLASSYVPYLTGSSRNPDTSVGHTRVPRNAGSQGPRGAEFVFTATMNGCAFAVTGDAQDDHFTAWHYQSPGSSTNAPHARRFRQDRSPTDWFDVAEYESSGRPGLFEAANILWNGPNGWEVLSQETRVNHMDMKDASIAKVRRRKLHLEAGHEVAYTISIYDGFARKQSDAVEELLQKMTKLAMPNHQSLQLIQHVWQPIAKAKARELADLGGARSFDELATMADTFRRRRASVCQKVSNWMKDDLHGEEETARGGLLNWSKRSSTLSERRNAIDKVLEKFSDSSWLDELKKEATARAGSHATAAGSHPS
ncbi:hypothetical protein ACWEO4_22035 [Streptomyces sp. NPDC004393]|uniref:hypothetical protein n=1 Tax=Streptomyces sp. NPDC004533 TaxID=3154278 RepID=UPI0033B43F5F